MGRILLIPAGLLALLIGAMVWSFRGVEEPANFTFVNRGDIKNLDLVQMTYMQDIRIGYALWEGLYTLDPVNLEAVPGCASPIEVSADKKTYTFHIRPEAKWSNGDDLKAKDFAFAWRRVLAEQGQYADLLHVIVGAAEFQKESEGDRIADFGKVGVEVIDGKTLRVKLVNATAYFPDLCAFPPMFPMHEATVMETVDGKRQVKPQWTRPPNIVTNGPYRLEKWEQGRRLRLKANEYYWDRKNVKSKIIDMLVMENVQSQLSMFDAGTLDWIAEMTGDIGAELKAQGRKELHVFTSFGTYFYSFNCNQRLPDGSPNPLKDIRVRQALTMAIDKQFIVDKITRLGEQVATTYIPRGAFRGYKSPAGLPYDVARAKKLLAEAGYPDGKGFPELKINFNTEFQHREVAEYLQREWKKNLNLSMVLDGKELKSYGDQLKNKEYAISRASWYGDYNDPSTFTDKYRPGNGNNDAAWDNAKFEALCEQAEKEPDHDKRLRLFEQAEEILLEEAPILPLYYYVNSYMISPKVTGLPMNARNMVMLQSIEVHR